MNFKEYFIEFKRRESEFLKNISNIIQVAEEDLSLYILAGNLYLLIRKKSDWELDQEDLYHLEGMGIDSIEYNTQSFVHM